MDFYSKIIFIAFNTFLNVVENDSAKNFRRKQHVCTENSFLGSCEKRSDGKTTYYRTSWKIY